MQGTAASGMNSSSNTNISRVMKTLEISGKSLPRWALEKGSRAMMKSQKRLTSQKL
jgi:hypothetical protein